LGIVERENGCKGPEAGFLLDGARIVGRPKAEFDLIHGAFWVMSVKELREGEL
jgi:hypothetical protein